MVTELFFNARRRFGGGEIATEATYSLTVRRTSKSFSACDFGPRALTTLTIFRAIGQFLSQDPTHDIARRFLKHRCFDVVWT